VNWTRHTALTHFEIKSIERRKKCNAVRFNVDMKKSKSIRRAILSFDDEDQTDGVSVRPLSWTNGARRR
jgi:hypothetical protein